MEKQTKKIILKIAIPLGLFALLIFYYNKTTNSHLQYYSQGGSAEEARNIIKNQLQKDKENEN